MTDRQLSGGPLQFSLAEEIGRTREGLQRGGRIARTLVKEKSLRVTLITVAPDGVIPQHHADGPLFVQMLAGALSFDCANETHELAEGDALSLPAGVPHAVRSAGGASFLLTIALSAPDA